MVESQNFIYGKNRLKSSLICLFVHFLGLELSAQRVRPGFMLTIPATGDEVATARWEERRRDGAVRYAKAAVPQKILFEPLSTADHSG